MKICHYPFAFAAALALLLGQNALAADGVQKHNRAQTQVQTQAQGAKHKPTQRHARSVRKDCKQSETQATCTKNRTQRQQLGSTQKQENRKQRKAKSPPEGWKSKRGSSGHKSLKADQHAQWRQGRKSGARAEAGQE